MKIALKKYPALVKTMENRHIVYNETLDYISKLESEGKILVYDHLFMEEDPSTLEDWIAHINKQSEVVLPGAMIEESLVGKKIEDHVQFERLGYFVVDKDSAHSNRIVYNRTCALKSN